MGIMDTGATSGAAAEHDTDAMKDTGEPSTKVFMLPDKSKIGAICKMLLKHNLRGRAREMNVVLGLHSTLVSIPKFADANYIMVFDKFKASIYDATTTTLAALAEPVVVAPRCKSTRLWKLDLNAETEATQTELSTLPINEAAHAIFKLPNNRQTILYYHAAAGFPTKETFLAAIRAGNYATWLGLTTALTNKHFPDSDEGPHERTTSGGKIDQDKGVRTHHSKKTTHKN
jgi:hypothetical protein